MSQEFAKVDADVSYRELREAFERYERDLPMTVVHVAKLLAISERSVRRIVRVAGRSKPGGTRWYSRVEVEAVWRGGGEERGGIGLRRRRGGGSRSLIVGSAGFSSRSPSTGEDACVKASVEEVERRLRGELSSESPNSSGRSVRLIRRALREPERS